MPVLLANADDMKLKTRLVRNWSLRLMIYVVGLVIVSMIGWHFLTLAPGHHEGGIDAPTSYVARIELGSAPEVPLTQGESVKGRIDGQVVDMAGRGVARAHLQLLGRDRREAFTDDGGFFSFTTIEFGVYALLCRKGPLWGDR